MTKKERTEYMRSLGKKGGAATKKKHGTKHYQLIGRKGQKALVDKLSSL
jgi:hypothetical protein